MNNELKDKPLVSIRLMTYNHAAYIEQALLGIDMQKTDFNFEVVIGDDFSTDGNLDKIKEYQFLNKKISVNILARSVGDAYYMLRKKHGRLHNFVDILNNCRGKYIALLDGDDYWTDPFKLQRQVDFMEANPEYGICFHDAKVIWDQNENSPNIELNSQFPWNKMSINKYEYNISDVLNGPFMATASVLYRNSNIKEYPNWFRNAASGDMALYAILIRDKKIKFFNEVMCAYRRHNGGITKFHRGNGIILNRIQTLKHINEYYDNKYIHIIRSSVSDYLGAIKSLNFQEYVLLLRLYITSTIVEKKYIVSFFKRGVKKIL